jgi:hypothetical protein
MFFGFELGVKIHPQFCSNNRPKNMDTQNKSVLNLFLESCNATEKIAVVTSGW